MADGPRDLDDVCDLREGELRVVHEIDGVGPHGVVVCRVDGALHALENNCSHRDAALGEGRLRGHLLMCPLHGAAFDVRDGSHQGPPAFAPVACFRVDEHDGRATLHVDRPT